jgi:DNA repair protein RecN (Recombination protein N)
LKQEFAGTYQTVKGITEKIAQIENAARDAERERDILSYKLDELEKAALIPGEDEDLERERNLLSHAGKLLDKTGTAYDLLYGGENSALGTMGAVKGLLRDAAAIDHSLAPLREAVDTVVLQLEDAALTLRDYAARIESDPLRLQSVDDRLELIRRMKKKYGATIEEVIACRGRLEEEFSALSDLEGSRASLEEEAERLRNLLRRQGELLSAGRRDAAGQLHVALEKEVHQLALKHAVFTVVVEPLSEPRETGYDRVEFLFSPNPGEDAKPLAKIASGGELSRIMLAMKQIHPESDVPTLIFDEVDTGIGGATSSLVGQKLKTVASRQQVLCITHMPQVAVFADNHYRVAKNVVDGRTITTVAHLGNEERVDEIARMLGGVSVTAKTLEHAREMIETASTA